MRRFVVVGLVAGLLAVPRAAVGAPELSTGDQLNTRRYVAAGERAYVMGFQDGGFSAQGWHVTGEMGGVWSQPLKLVDGLWFGIDGAWLPAATRFTSGWGYTRMQFPRTSGLSVSRTDLGLDTARAALLGLRLENAGRAAKSVRIDVDAHSELMSHYPWASTMPNAGAANGADVGAYQDGALVFSDGEKAAVVGANARPQAGETGAGHTGPITAPVTCEADSQFFCDEGPFGKGTGGRLRYRVTVPARGSTTLWIGVAGSEQGTNAARAQLRRALADPAGALRAKQRSRERWARYTQLALPADRRLATGIEWGKQNLLDLTQRADGLQVRDVDEGKQYPPPLGTVPSVRWIGAGYPDYPWIFATDAEYTAFAAVAAGQFEAIADHARALRDVSVILNGQSGKVAHEIVADGSVYFGSLEHAGNTDETAKFPSLVALLWRWTGSDQGLYPFAVRNLRYVVERLDADHDGWPEGLGNVEREGMGAEKLDNAVYTIRGLYDLADMARAKRDRATAAWAAATAGTLEQAFEAAWWSRQDGQYYDSLDPASFQKHWIGSTPMEAELTKDGRAWPGLASPEHGAAALTAREGGCYSGERPFNPGLFHTGCGGGPTGAGERSIFGLNTAIQAVGEGNYGRLAEQKRYTDAEVEPMFAEPYSGGDAVHHTPGTPDEQPGASPEIFPSPDVDPAGPRDASVERCTRCRAMVMQAWNQYGTIWPVVHQQLGVRPDLGRGRLEVVPQLPPHEPWIGAANIRLGTGAVKAIKVTRHATVLDTGSAPIRALTIGRTLAAGTRVRRVTLDGRKVKRPQIRTTNRGVEVTVTTRPGKHVLRVN